ncbi:MAG: biotin transporter BioY [Clostridia bacterium]|nr:biotin transporter BioY [Clostridia bacterium]
MKTKDIVHCGIVTALLCVLCPIAIPISGIPITLATLVIYITCTVCKLHTSLISVMLYILLGCIGLPVFSGFSGGVTHIAGPVGGFILGYIPLVICVSLLNKGRPRQIIGMCIGTVLLYICGCIGFMLNTDKELLSVLSACILPFLPGDALKITIAILAVPKINIIFKKK